MAGNERDREQGNRRRQQRESREDVKPRPAEQQRDGSHRPEDCCRVGEVGVGHTATGGQD